MSCGLIDLGCHIQGAAWEWWAEVGLLNKVLIVGGLLGIVLGAWWGVIQLLHRIGGWPASIGATAVLLGFVLAMLPKPPAPRTQPPNDYPFGTERLRRDQLPTVKPAERPRSLQDLLERLRTKR